MQLELEPAFSPDDSFGWVNELFSNTHIHTEYLNKKSAPDLLGSPLSVKAKGKEEKSEPKLKDPEP